MSHAEHIRSLRRSGQHEAAKALAVELAILNPFDAELLYEAACVHDFLGLGAVAISFYCAALAGKLPEEMEKGAYLGLCSTYRSRGDHTQALAVINKGLLRFPSAPDLRVFQAMTFYNLNRSKDAVATLLHVLCETAADPDIRKHERAILLYASDLDRQWP
ncbi:tetratricopeptide repeat protein [Burkholderia pyrrocinia]|uniref:Tetratricopeptide repeat protein n=1 Tax=Burkholderia pyrrocinia TaxID=60550 RepID=A0ABZ3BT34_BURPY